jgi:hypothetical protein
MARARHTDIPLRGLAVTDARDGSARDLGDLVGVNVVVLMRHRH